MAGDFTGSTNANMSLAITDWGNTTTGTAFWPPAAPFMPHAYCWHCQCVGATEPRTLTDLVKELRQKLQSQEEARKEIKGLIRELEDYIRE